MDERQDIQLFKCLADATRLEIVRSLHREPMYVERLAERLERTPSTISFHLKKLVDCGLVTARKEQYYTVYSLCGELLNRPLRELVCAPSGQDEIQAQREEAYRRKVLETFFHYGRLTALPVQRKKERIVLEEIARRFETGRTYAEREVNVLIADCFDDFCTIRRDMISEGLLARNHQIYWKPAQSGETEEKP